MARPLTFGELLTKMRDESGVFQREVAEAAEVALATVCDWEKGRRNPPTSTRAFAIAKLFGKRKVTTDECAELVISAARTRGSFVFVTENEHTLRLLAAIGLNEERLNKKRVDKIITLL